MTHKWSMRQLSRMANMMVNGQHVHDIAKALDLPEKKVQDAARWMIKRTTRKQVRKSGPRTFKITKWTKQNERRALLMVAEGNDYLTIGNEFNVSADTVRWLVNKKMKQYGANGRVNLIHILHLNNYFN